MAGMAVVEKTLSATLLVLISPCHGTRQPASSSRGGSEVAGPGSATNHAGAELRADAAEQDELLDGPRILDGVLYVVGDSLGMQDDVLAVTHGRGDGQDGVGPGEVERRGVRDIALERVKARVRRQVGGDLGQTAVQAVDLGGRGQQRADRGGTRPCAGWHDRDAHCGLVCPESFGR